MSLPLTFSVSFASAVLPPGGSDYQVPMPTVTAVYTDHILLLFPLAHELPQTEKYFKCICLLAEIQTG